MSEFSGKVVLLTGAAGGIGCATAKLFVERGASVVLADLQEDAVNEIAATLDPTGQRTAGCRYDATSRSSAEQVVKFTLERFGQLDVLVPGAGIYQHRLLTDITEQDWSLTLDVNLTGVMRIIQLASPVMSENSAITLVTSIASERGSLNAPHYAATKGGVAALGKSLARQLAPKTRVNMVAPGVIVTPMTDDLTAQQGTSLKASTPLARYGQPHEVAEAIAFMSSDRASFITGETININGGLHIE